MEAEALRRVQIERFNERGYVVVPEFLNTADLASLNRTALTQLQLRAAPLELEADLRYPGAPRSRDAAGGQTVRRLLDAYHRDTEFAEWASASRSRQWLESYFGEPIRLSLAHHNCLMTKHPRYGSMTGWHRDMRFWSFEHEDLVSVWLALGEERAANGALWLVPGSHRMDFDAERFDAAKFFRSDRADNREIIQSAESPSLAPGDALFFHCNTLHSAGQNMTDRVKFSLVYTYHGHSNRARPGTRSASKAEVELPAGLATSLSH